MSPMRISCAAVIATILAACSRSDSTADTTAATGGALDTAGTVVDVVPASAPTGAIGTASAASVGRYLTDANGRSLYAFVKDQKNVSSCSDACAAAWPPFGAGSAASTDTSVKSAMVGTITRGDGRSQSTYNGMPVYYYEDDKKPGDITGQGKNEFGGLWYVVSPSGQRITRKR